MVTQHAGVIRSVCEILVEKLIKIIIIPGNHDFKDLQKTAILSTSHILRKVLK